MTRYPFCYVGLNVLLIASIASTGIAEDSGKSPDDPAAPKTQQEGIVHKPTSALNRPNHRFFNVRLAGGADIALGDTLEKRGFGEAGEYLS